MSPMQDWRITNNKATSILGGKRLDKEDFAYTPDPDEPSTWKLRIDDARHVAGAIAALGEGFRGYKARIPKEDLAEVKHKVLAAWKKYHKNQQPPEVLNMANNARWVDDDEDGDDDDDESGDISKNSSALAQAELANDASADTTHHLPFTTDALEASQIAARLGANGEAHTRAAMGHDLAARKHDEAAELYPAQGEEHRKAAKHHRHAKRLHEEAMTNNCAEVTTNKKLAKLSNDELDRYHKEVVAEKNRRDMNGFLGLTYQNPAEDTLSSIAGSAYEDQDPENIDWEQELAGLGLSHNAAAELGLSGRPTSKDWFSTIPSEYQDALRNAVQTTNRERGMLLQQLTANMSEEHRHIALNRYKKLPMDELRQMVQMFSAPQAVNNNAPPSLEPIFAGAAGGAPFVTNQQELGTDAMLPLPRMDWKEAAEAHRR